MWKGEMLLQEKLLEWGSGLCLCGEHGGVCSPWDSRLGHPGEQFPPELEKLQSELSTHCPGWKKSPGGLRLPPELSRLWEWWDKSRPGTALFKTSWTIFWEEWERWTTTCLQPPMSPEQQWHLVMNSPFPLGKAGFLLSALLVLVMHVKLLWEKPAEGCSDEKEH